MSSPAEQLQTDRSDESMPSHNSLEMEHRDPQQENEDKFFSIVDAAVLDYAQKENLEVDDAKAREIADAFIEEKKEEILLLFAQFLDNAQDNTAQMTFFVAQSVPAFIEGIIVNDDDPSQEDDNRSDVRNDEPQDESSTTSRSFAALADMKTLVFDDVTPQNDPKPTTAEEQVPQREGEHIAQGNLAKEHSENSAPQNDKERSDREKREVAQLIDGVRQHDTQLFDSAQNNAIEVLLAAEKKLMSMPLYREKIIPKSEELESIARLMFSKFFMQQFVVVFADVSSEQRIRVIDHISKSTVQKMFKEKASRNKKSNLKKNHV